MKNTDGNASRFLLALGGFLGFSAAFAGAWNAGTDSSAALWRGSVGMIAGALMMKALLHVIYSSAREARMEKARALRARKQEAGAEQPVPADSR